MDALAPERETIVYRLTWPDVKAVEKQMRAANVALRVQYLAQRVAVPAIVIGVPLYICITEGLETLRKAGWWMLYPPLLVIGLFALFGYLHRRSIKQSGILDFDMAAALRDEGLWQKDRGGEGVAFWASIRNISETADHIFFRFAITELFQVVPKRAFQSPEAARAFYTEAMRLWSQHRGAP